MRYFRNMNVSFIYKNYSHFCDLFYYITFELLFNNLQNYLSSRVCNIIIYKIITPNLVFDSFFVK